VFSLIRTVWNISYFGDYNQLFVKLLTFPVLSLLFSLSLKARGPVSIEPAPAWVMATETNKIQNSNDKNISGGFYYDLIDRQINMEKKTVFVHVIRHIVNESGIQDVCKYP